jgi:hypothetical protein
LYPIYIKGMKLRLLLIPLICLGQTAVNLGRQGVNANFSNFSYTYPFKIGTTLPSTCSVGMSFFKTNATAGSNIYGCTATNTWTVEGGGGGLTIGSAVSGGTNNYNLYIDGSGNLAQEQYLGAGRFPALSGDISTTAGSLTTAIGAGKVTNTMLAGSITAANLVGTDIATVGTITTGVWHGTIVGGLYGGTGNGFFAVTGPTTSLKTFTFPNSSATVLTDNAVVTGAQGGTGVANTGSTITLGGNLITSGAFALTLTQTGTTNVTLPTSGTLLTTTGSGTSLTFPGSLSIATGKTLTASNTLTFTGTDSSSVAFGAGGTVLYAAVTSIATTSPITGGTITGTGTIACATCGVTETGLQQFAATTSAQLAGVLSDETGSGLAVFGTSPTLTTPAITTSVTLSNNNILAVSTDGIISQNTTAADSTNKSQWSPRLRLIGQVWDGTSASQQSEFRIEMQPRSISTAPTAQLVLTPIQNNVAMTPIAFCGQGTSDVGTTILLDGSVTCRKNSIATGLGVVNSSNVFGIFAGGAETNDVNSNGFVFGSTKTIAWYSSTVQSQTTGDVGLYRGAAGELDIDAGSATGCGTVANCRDLKIRHLGASGTAPTLSSCGTSPTLATGASDMAGTINVGSGTVTACTLTFGTAFTNAPTCVMNDDSTAVTGDISSISTTAVTFSFSVSIGSGHIYYVCVAGSGM